MRSDLTLEISYDDDGNVWAVGALSRWAGRIELARSAQLGPFAGVADVEKWLLAMWAAWAAPTLGMDASESLHEAFIEHV